MGNGHASVGLRVNPVLLVPVVQVLTLRTGASSSIPVPRRHLTTAVSPSKKVTSGLIPIPGCSTSMFLVTAGSLSKTTRPPMSDQRHRITPPAVIRLILIRGSLFALGTSCLTPNSLLCTRQLKTLTMISSGLLPRRLTAVQSLMRSLDHLFCPLPRKISQRQPTP